jgi:hypothetical protein
MSHFTLYLYKTSENELGSLILHKDIAQSVIESLSKDVMYIAEYDFDPANLANGFMAFGDTDDLENITIEYNQENDVNMVKGQSLYINGNNYAEYLTSCTGKEFVYIDDNTYTDMSDSDDEFGFERDLLENICVPSSSINDTNNVNTNQDINELLPGISDDISILDNLK